MIKIKLFCLFTIVSGFLFSCKESTSRSRSSKTEKIVGVENERKQTKVAFLIYPEVAILDMTGPMDAFIKINRMTENQYDVYTVSATTDMIKTQGHIIEIKADYTFKNAPKADIFIIPGAKMDIVQALTNQSDYAKFIKEQSIQAKTTMSVCTGSFILGKLGLLDGKKATTHWILGKKFADDFKHTELIMDVRYVKDGNLVTTSGVATGIDGALVLIKEYTSPEFASMAARALQYKTKIKEKWPELPTKPMNHGDSDPIN